MIENASAVFFIAPSFKLKTGYYFRAQRDKEQFEKQGFKVFLLNFLDYLRDLKIKSFINIVKKSNILVSQNVSMILPIMIMSLLGMTSKKKKILVLHGSLKELEIQKASYVKRFLYPLLLKFALNKFDSLVLVSEAMKKDIEQDFGKIKISTYVMPNIPMNEFFAECSTLRKKKVEQIKKLICLPENKFIITYSGNMQEWQKVDLLLDTFKILNKHSDKFFLNVLTKELSSFKKEIERRNITDNFSIQEVKNSEVPKHLIASSILWSVREDNHVNKVSCPTKIIEYICSGNQIIISRNIGDLSSFIEKNDKGLIIDSSNLDPNSISKLLMSFEKNARKELTEPPYVYSYEHNLNNFKRLLEIQ